MNINTAEHSDSKFEVDTLLRAMAALKLLAPLEYETKAEHDRQCDHVVRLTTQGKEILLCAQVKSRLTKADEMLVMLRQKELPYPLLLATDYITVEAATRLRDNSVQFVDTVGNAYINQPPLYIFVKGNKPEKTKAAPRTGRLFTGVGLKLVYLLLCRPELAGKPYRELAEMADIAVGTVNGVMAEMVRKGFILDMGRSGKKLMDRKTLFERWVAAYPEYLKPKLMLGRFRADGDWWKNVHLDPAVAQWGGEVAAAKLTGYLKPGTATLYIDENRMGEFVITNRLKKDPQGNVEVLKRFWPAGDEDDTVHPVLVYADLAAAGEQRTMETARLIYEQHLDRYLRQD